MGFDPGHGGKDPGAVSKDGAILEKHITYTVTKKVVEKLKKMERMAILIQPSSDNPNSTGRDELYLPPKIANQLHVDYYFSIHVNSGGGEGFESFASPNASMETLRIQHLVHTYTYEFLKKYGMRDRGEKLRNFYVINPLYNHAKAILLEVGFIDNEHDLALLASADFLEKLANQLAYIINMIIKEE